MNDDIKNFKDLFEKMPEGVLDKLFKKINNQIKNKSFHEVKSFIDFYDDDSAADSLIVATLAKIINKITANFTVLLDENDGTITGTDGAKITIKALRDIANLIEKSVEKHESETANN